MTSTRPTKRPRTRAVARRERQEGPTLASVLLPMVQEGFLRHQELGRLGQTSRQLNHQCKKELWKTLCYHRWPNTSSFSESTIVSLGGGYSGWYRIKISTIPEEPRGPPRLAPPTLRPQDVHLSVDITRGEESLVSVFVCGASIAALLKIGRAGVQLNCPAIIGNGACFLQGTCSCDRRCRFNLVDDDFDVTMHLYRSGETPCRIYQSMKHNPSYSNGDDTDVQFPIDGTSKWWEEPRENYIDLGPGVPNRNLGLPFRWTPIADRIVRRLRASIYFMVLPNVEVIEKQGEKVVAITGFSIHTMKFPNGDTDSTDFDCTKEANEHGVTLLHILQELQSTQL